jgi:2-amino-4-hydroxy-6-hydroxymethyldihydropteridine diphosphokinase
MNRYAIALGGNLGDRLGFLQGGVEALGSLGEIESISGLYETEPVGGPSQGPYLNAVVTLLTELEPEPLLVGLQEIERDAGRERSVRWGERTLDLDIVAHSGAEVRTADLQIPHQRAAERRFVLQPLVDVWPEAVVADGVTAQQALASVGAERVDSLSRRWADPTVKPPGRYWVVVQFVLFLVTAISLAFDGSLPGEEPEVTRIIGGVLVFAGVVLAFLSVRKLGKSMTATPEPLPDADLIQTGPFSLARHPIYGGVFMILMGTSLVVDSVYGAVLSLGLFVFFLFKSTYEERQLRIAYPEYQSYRDRVRRRLIPFIF